MSRGKSIDRQREAWLQEKITREDANNLMAKLIHEYHARYHTPLWKRIALRLYAEKEAFLDEVHERYGKQYGARKMAVSRVFAKVSAAFRRRPAKPVNGVEEVPLPPPRTDPYTPPADIETPPHAIPVYAAPLVSSPDDLPATSPSGTVVRDRRSSRGNV